MALGSGTHKVGPAEGSLHVYSYRDGMAQKVGHDLIIDVQKWEGIVEVDGDQPAQLTLDADGGSLRVREGVGGAKPLGDKDHKKIHDGIDDDILRKQPIAFRSTLVSHANGGLTIGGDLTLVGTTRPASFDLALSDDGRLRGKVTVTQSEWGIKPYKALMGALKVRDEIEIAIDVALPTS